MTTNRSAKGASKQLGGQVGQDSLEVSARNLVDGFPGVGDLRRVPVQRRVGREPRPRHQTQNQRPRPEGCRERSTDQQAVQQEECPGSPSASGAPQADAEDDEHCDQRSRNRLIAHQISQAKTEAGVRKMPGIVFPEPARQMQRRVESNRQEHGFAGPRGSREQDERLDGQDSRQNQPGTSPHPEQDEKPAGEHHRHSTADCRDDDPSERLGGQHGDQG